MRLTVGLFCRSGVREQTERETERETGTETGAGESAAHTEGSYASCMNSGTQVGLRRPVGEKPSVLVLALPLLLALLVLRAESFSPLLNTACTPSELVLSIPFDRFFAIGERPNDDDDDDDDVRGRSSLFSASEVWPICWLRGWAGNIIGDNGCLEEISDSTLISLELEGSD